MKKRKKVSVGKDKKIFNRTAKRTVKVNINPNESFRGGIRL